MRNLALPPAAMALVVMGIVRDGDGLGGEGLEELVAKEVKGRRHDAFLSATIFFTSPIAFAGFSPFGQVLAQFMIVWQRYSLNGSSSASSRSSVLSSRLSMIQR